MKIQNPIPAAVRFLQNFPGMCKQAAQHISKAAIAAPDLALRTAVLILGLNISASVAIELIKTNTKQALKTPLDTGLFISCGLIPVAAAVMTVGMLNAMRKFGKQTYQPTP